MKKATYLFFGILISLTALSVLGKNNFTNGFGFFEEARITQNQIHELVNQQMVEPLTKCYYEAYPETLMMKCTAYIKFEINGRRAQYMDENTTFGPTERVDGVIMLDNCGAESHLCQIQVLYSKSEINVRESFFEPWVTTGDFVKNFCKKITASATPE